MRLFIIFFLFFLNIFASDSYERGEKLYKQKSCGNCHGAKLQGMNTYPYLANRSGGFLSYKLKRFRSRKSDNQQQEMMIPFATSLSDKELEDLVVYMVEYVDEINSDRYDDSYEVHGDGGS